MKKQIIAAMVVLMAATAGFGATVTFNNPSVPQGTPSVTLTISVSGSAAIGGADVVMGSNTLDLSGVWTPDAGLDYSADNGDPNFTSYAGERWISGGFLNVARFVNPLTLGTLTIPTAGLAAGTYYVYVDGSVDGISGVGYASGFDSLTGTGTITIVPPPGAPVIAAIPNASIAAGNTYTGPTPVLSQGTLPVTWSLVVHPAGMTIDPDTGVVSWPNATTAGSPHTITIKASNGAGNDTKSWDLTVTPAVIPAIAAIPNAAIQAPNAYTGPTPSLTQGTPVVTWSLETGPSGMTIDSASGVVSWPASTDTGSPHTITIKATNSAGFATQTWQLTVTPASAIPVIAAIPDATVQAPDTYLSPIPALTQGTLPVTWSKVAGPADINVDVATGQVFWGVPTATGSPHTITIQATNSVGSATQTWQVTVLPAIIPVIAAIPDETVDTSSAYTGPTPVLTQGTPEISWWLMAGPSGMTVNGHTGVISWPQPTTAGSPYTITIRATNSMGDALQTWHLTVTEPQVPPVITAIPDASVQAPNAYTGPTPILTQGTQPVTWTLEAGPSGMTIDADTGVVSWPASTMTGSPFTITIKAANHLGSATETWQLTVTPAPAIPVIAAIPAASVLAPHAYRGPTPVLTQGTQPVTWSLVAGPSGMIIDSATGRVSWPASTITDSPYTITIKAANSAGNGTQTWQLTVTSSPVAPVIAEIPDATIKAPDAYTGPTPVLSQGTLPVTWSLIAGPSGMTIDSDTGVVSWPTSSTEGSPRTITIMATNDAGSATQSWDLTITSSGPVNPGGIVLPSCGKGGSENLLGVGLMCLLSLMLGKRFVGGRR